MLFFFTSFYLTCNVCKYVSMFVRVKSYNSILKQISSTDSAEILYARSIWMTMHGLLCDVTLNPIWLHVQNGALVIFHALLQYGYQMEGLVMNNSKTKVTFF
jgi:hypothetical protein